MEPRVRDQLVLVLVPTLLFLLSGAALATNDIQGDDVVRVGGDVTVAEGQVVKDAVAIARSVTVLSGGRVTHNAVAIGGDVTLKANAHVEGDAVTIGGEILKGEGASVGGKEVVIVSGAKGVIDAVKRWGLLGLLYRAYLASVILHLLVVLFIAAVGVLLLLLLPGPLQIISATIRQYALKSGAWGVGSLLAIFLLSVLTTGSLLGTLIEKMTAAQILFVFGHEMGHYVLGHIPRLIAFFWVVLLVLLYLGYRGMHWALRRWGRRWAIRGMDDWASLPVLLFCSSLFLFLAAPLLNTHSRYVEHEADIYGLEVIHGVVSDSQQAAAEAFQVLGEIDLADPDPSPFIKVWLYDHPALNERILFAQSYDPWSQGQAPAFVK